MFGKLNAFKNWEHMAYLKLKLGEWYCEAPNGASPAALTGDKEVAWGPAGSISSHCHHFHCGWYRASNYFLAL